MYKLNDKNKFRANVFLAGLLLLIIIGAIFDFNCKSTDIYSRSVKGNNTVNVSPGDNIQQLINDSPGDTTFIFTPGTYREYSLTPKTGNIFVGEYGAVLNGSKVLTQFVQEGNLWYAPNQTQRLGAHGSCNSAWPRCNRREKLYINGVMLLHTDSIAKVTADTYFFDFDTSRIYFGQDPAGKLIETTTTIFAFQTNSTRNNDNVTIQNFTVEKYGSWAQRGVILQETYDGGSSGWIVEHNEIRLNAGAGVTMGDNSQYRYNKIHSNGQLGVGGGGKDSVFEYNEVSNNNIAKFSSGWEAGGAKFASGTENLIVRGNYAHGNFGPGLWTDINNYNTLYDGNISVDNSGLGISHEISFDAEFRNNYLAGNAVGDIWFWASQIMMQNSQNGYVHDNTIILGAGYSAGMSAITQASRGSSSIAIGPYPAGTKYLGINNRFENNDLYNVDGSGKFIGVAGDDTTSPYAREDYANANTFDGNRYHIVNSSYQNNGLWELPTENSNGTWSYSKNWANVQNLGYEQNGQIITIAPSEIPGVPNWDYEVGPVEAATVVVQEPFDVPIAIPGTIEVENYDLGGEGLAFSDVSSQNYGASTYRGTDAVDVKDAGSGNYTIGWNETGDWLEYTVDVQSTDLYEISINAASADNNSIQMSMDSSILGVYSVPNEGAYSPMKNYVLGEVNLTQGQHIFRVDILDQWVDIDSFEFATVVPVVVCGNGVVETGEVCDDGNTVNNDQCSLDCLNSCAADFKWNGFECISRFQNVVTNNLINLEAENYNLGGQNVGYNDLSSGNSGGVYRTDDVDIKSIGSNNYAVTSMENGEWLEYTFTPVQAGKYRLTVVAGTDQSDSSITLSIGSQSFSATVQNTSDFNVLDETIFNDILFDLTPSQTTIRLLVSNQSLDIDSIRLERVSGVQATCGNNIVEEQEQCDDGNQLSNDGCSATCRVEIVEQISIQCGSLDVNADLKIDIVDLVSFVQAFNKKCNDSPYNPALSSSSCGGKDTNSDSKVSIVDLIYFITLFNKPACTI